MLRTLCFSAILLVLVSFGFRQFSGKNGGHGCRMTYMYEIPEFIPVKLNDDHEGKFPNYKLYIYGEGTYASSLKRRQYNGIPVLFLPGNAGSFKQVRSLASVALTKAASNRSPFHFNYFTVDFNEEMSAFYGPALYREAGFAAICIRFILSLYQSKPNPPNSVIVVGHSMGGVVARALFTLPDFEMSSVEVIISLATPQLQPVIMADPYIKRFYEEINAYWIKNRNGTLRHVNIVSIGGGHRDVMVRSDLVAMPWKEVSDLDVAVISTAIPDVWTSMDHLCILWCNQLVLRTVRTTFHMVDKKTKQIEKNVNKRNRLLQDAFLPDATQTVEFFNRPSLTDIKSWIKLDSSQSHFHISSESGVLPHLLLLSLNESREFIAIFNAMKETQRIFGCASDFLDSTNSNQTICDKTWTLPCQPLQVPSIVGNRRIFRCQEKCCEGASHLIIELPHKHVQGEVIMQSYDRTTHSHNLTLLEGLYSSSQFEVPDQSSFFQIGFPYLTDTLLAYQVTVFVSGISCPDDAGTSHFKVPWSSEDTFEPLKKNGTTHTVHLFKASDNLEFTSFPVLFLYLHSDCKYMVKVDLSLSSSLEQMVRFNYGLVPALTTAAILVIFSRQLISLSVKGICSSALNCFSLLTLIRDVVLVHVGATFLETMQLKTTSIHSSWLLSYGTASNVFIHLFSYLVCYVAVILICGLLSFCLTQFVKLETMISNLCRLRIELKILCRSWKLEKLMFLVLMGIISISCSAFAFSLLSALSSIKVLKHLKLVHVSPTGDHGTNAAKCHLNITMLLWWIMMHLLSGPAFLFWIKSERFSGPLSPDPSFIPAIFIVLSVYGSDPVEGVLQISRKHQSVLASVQWCSSLGILLFTRDDINMILWILAFNTAVLARWPMAYKCWTRFGQKKQTRATH